MGKKCKYCGDLFVSRSTKREHCKSNDCENSYLRERYNKHLVLKNCLECSTQFKGKGKVLYCSKECVEKSLTISLEQNYMCIYCSNMHKTVIREVKKTSSHSIKPIIKKLVCDECKEKTRLKLSETRKGKNNPNWKNIKKVRERKFDTREEFKKNMSINNPMYVEETKLKASNTLKEKYENGEIVRPIGKLSPLWKGNRKKSFTIRTRLSEWRKKHLKDSEYTCTLCDQVGGKLEVHHEETLRDIIHKFTEGKSLDDYNYEDFTQLVENIVNYHDVVKGIVLCEKCHGEIDEFRKLKNENKKDRSN